MNRAYRGVLLVAIAATIAGCSQASGPPAGSSAPSITPTTDTPPIGTTAPAAPPSRASQPTVAASRPIGDVQARAVAFMTAFAATKGGETVWWAGVKPLLTRQGAAAYLGTDPTLIPVHQVTGPATMMPAKLENAQQVRVPSDAGVYEVWLNRAGPAAPWLVERIVPPTGQR